MITTQPLDMEDEHEEGRPTYESYGYGECAMSMSESDML